MLDCAREAVAATRGRTRQDLRHDAILAAALERFIEVIGEAAGKVSEATRDELGGLPWREMIGMRNRLVHGYASVDRDVVWAVATGDLPALVGALEEALKRDP